MFLRVIESRNKYEGFFTDRKVGDRIYRGVVLKSVRIKGVSRHRYIGTLFNVSDRELIEMTRRQAAYFYGSSLKRMKGFGANESEVTATGIKLLPLIRLTEFGGKSLETRLSTLDPYHYERKGTGEKRKPYLSMADKLSMIRAYQAGKIEK